MSKVLAPDVNVTSNKRVAWPTVCFAGEFRNLHWIVLLAFVLRATIRWHLAADDFWTNGYGFFFNLARSIAAGNGFAVNGHPTAFRVPLYPAFLAVLTFGQKAFVPILLAQSLIGAATVLCAALIAREMFGNAAALMAAFLTAIYPYYVIHDTALQETSLYTFLTALAVFLLMRVRRSGSLLTAACAGIVLGLAVLARANLALFALAAPLWLIVPEASAKAPWRHQVLSCMLCAGTLALILSPWLVRSYALTGSPSLSTQSGFFLWLGNNPYTFSRYPVQSIDLSERVALAALSPSDRAQIAALGSNEAAVDRWFLERGLDYMLANPVRAFVSGLRKIAAGFCVLPSPRKSFWPSLFYLFSYGPIMLLGTWGMWHFRRRWREHLIFYLLFASFTGITAVFFGHTSYRVYLDVYWIVFAAGLLEQFVPSHVDAIRMMATDSLRTKHRGLV